jgi:hypothetical protein
MRNVNPVILVILLTLLMIGCTSSTDERLLEQAKEHAARQAETQKQMARLQQEVAEGSHKLVEADAKAREELTTLQHDLRSDQAEIGHQRDQLEAERRGIAAQRNRDPIIAAAIMNTGLVLACLLPLLVCVYVLWCVGKSRDSDEAVTELLVEELVTDHPRLLPLSSPLPSLPHQRSEITQADGSSV